MFVVCKDAISKEDHSLIIEEEWWGKPQHVEKKTVEFQNGCNYAA